MENISNFRANGPIFKKAKLSLRKVSLKKVKKSCPSHPEAVWTRKVNKKAIQIYQDYKKFIKVFFCLIRRGGGWNLVIITHTLTMPVN